MEKKRLNSDEVINELNEYLTDQIKILTKMSNDTSKETFFMFLYGQRSAFEGARSKLYELQSQG